METGIELENIVAQPTWKEVLIDLVYSEKLDPWNIDIVEITERYIEKISKMQTLDLRIPANLVLAASILLRFKSDALKLEEEEQVVEEETYIEMDKPPIEVPILSIKTRIPPRRRLTLAELVMALDEVFQTMKKRMEERVIPEVNLPPMQFKLPEYDIEEKMKEILEKSKSLADTEGLLTFSSLLKEKTASEIILTLLPVLHLAQKRLISITQEEFYGEIFILLNKEEIKKHEEKIGKKKGLAA
ncbi:MAG: ScpA family protein [Candidatus Micrarchaeia archaeon]